MRSDMITTRILGTMPEVISPLELERYLHQHIPLTRAMQVSVRGVSRQGITLGAPLAPNINHHETAFGGSLATLATLSAWSLVYTRLLGEGIRGRLVIQRNAMSFETPVHGEFTATSAFAGESEWPAFLRMLTRRGKGRIAVTAQVDCSGGIAGRFSGEFVALDAQRVEPRKLTAEAVTAI